MTQSLALSPFQRRNRQTSIGPKSNCFKFVNWRSYPVEVGRPTRPKVKGDFHVAATLVRGFFMCRNCGRGTGGAGHSGCGTSGFNGADAGLSHQGSGPEVEYHSADAGG